MTEIILYPMALYPLKGDMIIVNNEQEHLDVLAAWEEVAAKPDGAAAVDRPKKNP